MKVESYVYSMIKFLYLIIHHNIKAFFIDIIFLNILNILKILKIHRKNIINYL